MSRHDDPSLLSIRESLTELTVSDLKPLARLIEHDAVRKGELVDAVAKILEDQKKVEAIYTALDDVSQKALQEATWDEEGTLRMDRFQAKYGQIPTFGGGRQYGDKSPPSTFRLFFPHYHTVLPHDLVNILRAFVPEPQALKISSTDELPATFKHPNSNWGESGDETVELRVRHTANIALKDVKAVLRLVDAGEVKVSDKTHRPSQASLTKIADVLLEGDFYGREEDTKEEWDPNVDLQMQPFAWPMLAGRRPRQCDRALRLQLTPAGAGRRRCRLHEVIRQLWQKWQKTKLLDEFNRINVIKGQQAKGKGLTAVAPRRETVVEVLQECPAGQWLAIDELFRLLKVLPDDFEVTHNAWDLYIAERQYGSLGYDGSDSWAMIQGRFVLAFLFEYAATLGLLDVAYISPDGARPDFAGLWGTDDLSCLSRYDGLMFVRINSLGAWCLGLVEDYQPEVIQIEPVIRVLPNLDVVAADRQLTPADILFLDRFLERASEGVWRLSKEKALAVVEQGLAIAELKQYLTARNDGPLPQTVQVFLDDLEDKAGQIEEI